MAWECALRNWAFEHGWIGRVQAAVPVVSVGNLTLGGTGKTPCVEYVARFIREQERRVAILSRGYGAEHGVNDEAMVLEENCRTCRTSRDRIAAAWRVAVEEAREKCWCSTTAFSIGARGDLDIVLLDATCPWGYGRCFRAACCAPPQLEPGHVILLTRLRSSGRPTASTGFARKQRGGRPERLPETTHQPATWVNASRATAPLEAAKPPGRRLLRPGKPGSVSTHVGGAGIGRERVANVPDHHGYTRRRR